MKLKQQEFHHKPRTEKGAVFLLDSGTSSETAPMVELFFKSMKNKNYNKIIKENFIKTTDDCVEDFLKGDFNSLFSNMKILSKLVLENFKPMIPKDFHDLWAKGIESDDYFLKLCGSGGGGYIFGFSKDFEKAKKGLYPITNWNWFTICNVFCFQ